MRQISAALMLRDELGAAGIPVVFLKGVALSSRAFGSPILRRAVDIDILVPIGAADAAGVVLDRCGLLAATPLQSLRESSRRLYRWVAKDSVHRDPASGITVELHWRMSDEVARPALPPAATWRTIAIAPGQALPALGDEAEFVYLCTHGAAHMWARLKWLADVAALLAAAPDGGASLWRAALAAHARVPAASAIVLAVRLFALPPPPGFTRPRSLRVRLLVHWSLRAIGAGGGALELEATRWRGWAEMAAKLLVAAGVRNRLAVLRRLAFSGQDVALLDLPRGLVWAYPLLRVPLLVQRRAQRRLTRSRRTGRPTLRPADPGDNSSL
jgi:hypothetical protein